MSNQQNNLEEIRQQIQLDTFIGAVCRTSSGGHPSSNRQTAQYESERQVYAKKVDAEIVRNASQK